MGKGAGRSRARAAAGRSPAAGGRAAEGVIGAPRLRPEEQAWLRDKAALVGGRDEALRRVVRLGILFEAVQASLVEHERLRDELSRSGLPPAQVRRRLRAWLHARAAWRHRDRFANLITWDRPGGEHFYGRAPRADPATPLPRAVAKQLVDEGAEVFARWP